MHELKLPWLGHLPIKDVDENLDKIILEKFHNNLVEEGYCYIKVIGGDYNGSIAKFTIDKSCKTDTLLRRLYSRSGGFNVKTYWTGRLSWDGKKNNPKFTITHSSCLILPDYKEETILKRFDLREESKKLLEKDVLDSEDNVLSIGDEVIYLNLRYGSGGALSKGVIKSFKGNARKGTISVIIGNNKDLEEESTLNYPSQQILKIKC